MTTFRSTKSPINSTYFSSWLEPVKKINSKYYFCIQKHDVNFKKNNNFVSIFHHLNNKDSIFYKYTKNSNNKYKGNEIINYNYDIYITSYTYENNEEVILAYKPENLKGGNKASYVLWIIGIFAFVFIIILFAAIYLFLQIKKFNEEETKEIQINKNESLCNYDFENLSMSQFEIE